MKLNHLNLAVTDVPAFRDFLVKYFGLQPGNGNSNIAFLTDESGLMLSLMSPKVGKESNVTYPGTFHIGFIQESEDRVNAINEHLRSDGFEVAPPSRQYGSWTFYVAAPGGVLIEVLC